MLPKGVYPYKYIDGSERFDEKSLPTKKEFYSNMTMESTTYADYKQAKRFQEGLRLQILGQYYHLYVQSDALLLTEVFESL